MWKRLAMLAVVGLLTSCGQQEVSAQDPQRTETSYKNDTDVSKIIELDDFFNGDSDLYSKLDKSNDTKSNYISINRIGNISLYKQNHYDGDDQYTSIVAPVEGLWNGLKLNRVEWGKSHDKMWGYFYLYFTEDKNNLSNKINKLMYDNKINYCFNEYLKEIDSDCYCNNYGKGECGKKLYPNMPVNIPTVEISIQPDPNSKEGSILSYSWST
jgi:hypothetical protein